VNGSKQLELSVEGTIQQQAAPNPTPGRSRPALAARAAHNTRKDAPGDAPVGCSPYLTTDDVALRLHCSRRSVHELTRTAAIPHRRAPGSRRCLFLEAELAAWLDGATLDVHELPRGGRVVKPTTAIGR
jgi:hypothetical protein